MSNQSSYSYPILERIWANTVRLTRTLYPNLQDEIEGLEYLIDDINDELEYFGDMKYIGSYSAIVYKDDEKIYARNKEGEIIAVGKAGVDDTRVIQNTINELSTGNTLFLASGTYEITSILIDKPINIVGNGKRSVILSHSNTATDALLTLNADGEYYTRIANLQLKGTTNGQDLLEITKTRYLKIVDVRFNDAGRDAIHINYLILSKIVDCQISAPQRYGIFAGGSFITTLWIRDTGVRYSKDTAVYIQAPIRMFLYNGGDIEYNYKHGIVLGDGSDTLENIEIKNVWFEENNLNNDSNIYDIYAGRNNTVNGIAIKGCRLLTDKTTYGIYLDHVNRAYVVANVFGSSLEPNVYGSSNTGSILFIGNYRKNYTGIHYYVDFDDPINLKIRGLLPLYNNSYNIGSSSLGFRNGYFTQKVYGKSGVVTKADVGDYGGNFTNYTPPTGEEGMMIVAIDTNSGNPGKRLYVYANGQWNYVDLT